MSVSPCQVRCTQSTMLLPRRGLARRGGLENATPAALVVCRKGDICVQLFACWASSARVLAGRCSTGVGTW